MWRGESELGWMRRQARSGKGGKRRIWWSGGRWVGVASKISFSARSIFKQHFIRNTQQQELKNFHAVNT